ncbi:MAG: GNAT family N-acetyltransferase [Pseudomonadota bacterium]
MSSIIRKVNESDAQAIAVIIRASFKDVADKFDITQKNAPTHPSYCTAEWIERDMASGLRYLLLETDEKIVGCVGYKTLEGHTLEAQRLAILPEYRGGSLARELNAAVLEYAVTAGLTKIRISIVAQHRALKQWYLRMGFVECETRNFENLPFQVTYLEYDVGKAGNY